MVNYRFRFAYEFIFIQQLFTCAVVVIHGVVVSHYGLLKSLLDGLLLVFSSLVVLDSFLEAIWVYVLWTIKVRLKREISILLALYFLSSPLTFYALHKVLIGERPASYIFLRFFDFSNLFIYLDAPRAELIGTILTLVLFRLPFFSKRFWPVKPDTGSE